MENVTKYYNDDASKGRPRGRQSYTIKSVLNSIALIAAKNNLVPTILFDAFTEAWMHDESHCENLKVECRQVKNEVAVFLITCNDAVIGQFPIEIEVLQQPNLFKSYIPTVSIPLSKDAYPIQKQISELRINMRGFKVTGKIVNVSQKMLVNTMYGWDAYVSNVLLADNTGSIRLSLWNGQIDTVAVGDTVCIEKGKVAMFRGELQLRIGRSGTMSVDTSTREITA